METLRTPDPPEIRMHHVPPRVHTPPIPPLPRPFPSTASHSSPLHKLSWQRLSTKSQSPPSEQIHPLGFGHQFSFTRSQSRELSSRTSSASGRHVLTSGPESRSRSDRGRSSSRKPTPLSRYVLDDGDLTVEELVGSEPGSDLEVLRPDSYEDAASNVDEGQRSDSEPHWDPVDAIAESIEGLECGDRNHKLRMKKRRQRWSQGSLKRSLGTSLESDTDLEDVSGFNAREMAKSGRRQRLRTDRLEEEPASKVEHNVQDSWLELEDSAEENHTRPTTSGSDTNGRAAETLPFFPLEDIMLIDEEPSPDTSPP